MIEISVERKRMPGQTWLVQTLLKVTKAKVCASIAVARFFLASTNGSATTAKKSWGINARDSKWESVLPTDVR